MSRTETILISHKKATLKVEKDHKRINFHKTGVTQCNSVIGAFTGGACEVGGWECLYIFGCLVGAGVAVW